MTEYYTPAGTDFKIRLRKNNRDMKRSISHTGISWSISGNIALVQLIVPVFQTGSHVRDIEMADIFILTAIDEYGNRVKIVFKKPVVLEVTSATAIDDIVTEENIFFVAYTDNWEEDNWKADV